MFREKRCLQNLVNLTVSSIGTTIHSDDNPSLNDSDRISVPSKIDVTIVVKVTQVTMKR